MGRFSFLQAVCFVCFLSVCADVGAGLFSLPLTAAGSDPAAALTLSGIALRHEHILEPGFVPEGLADGTRLSASDLRAFEIAVPGDVRSSALFFQRCDGLEYLVPPVGESLDMEALSGLLSASPLSLDRNASRLVLGFSWYYAACTPANSPKLTPGKYLLRFDGVAQPVPAWLLSVSSAGEGRSVLLFRLPLGEPALLSLRKCSAALLSP